MRVAQQKGKQVDFKTLVLNADTRGMKKGEEVLDDVADAAERADDRVRDAQGRFVKAGDSAKRAAPKLKQFSNETKAISISAASAAKGIAGLVAGYASFNTLGQSVGMARQFNAAIAETSTLIEGTPKQLEMLRGEARKLAVAYGGDATAQVQAFYQAISAGAGSVDEASKVLETANRLAVGGVTDITTAVDGLTTATNAYAAMGLTAQQASDAMFAGMRAGKTTVGELSASLGTVVPIASSAGVSFEELVGGMAALTTQGQSTAMAATGIRQSLANVIAPTKQATELAEALGIEFNVAGLKAMGFADFMDDVIDKTGGSEQALAQLFGSVESLNAVLAFSGGAGDAYNQIMADMANNAGLTDEAFTKVSNTLDQRWNRATAASRDALLGLGNASLNVLVPALEGVVSAGHFVADNFDLIASAALGLAATQIPAMIGGLGSLVTLMGTAATSAYALGTAITVALGPWGILAGLVAGAAGYFLLFSDNAGKAKAAAYDAAQGTKALNASLGIFYETAAPSASRAAIDLANDNYKLAASAVDAARAEIAKQRAIVNSSPSAGTIGGPFAGTGSLPSEKLTAAQKRLAAAEKALEQATMDRKTAATAVTGSMSEQIDRTQNLNSNLSVTIDNLDALTKASPKSGKAMTDAMKQAQKELRESERAAEKFAKALNQPVVNAVDQSVDYMVNGFENGFDGLKDILKRSLAEMAAFAIANPIKIGLGIGGTGTGALIGGGGSNNIASRALGFAANSAGSGGGLLSPILGSLGTNLFSASPALGTGFLGGVGSTLSSTFGAGGGIGGLFSIGGNAAAAGGGLLAAAGAAVPLLGAAVGVGALLSKAFGKKYDGSGYKGRISATGLQGSGYDKYSGGWFRSDSEERTRLPRGLDAAVDQATRAAVAPVFEAAGVLGLSTRRARSYRGLFFKTGIKGTEEEKRAKIERTIGKAVDHMAKLTLGTLRFNRAGETSTQTIVRLSTHLQGVNDLFEQMDKLTFDIGLVGADAASDLVRRFGSMDQLNSQISGYYDAFFTEEERRANTLQFLKAEFEDLGLVLPASRAAFRQTVEGLDLMTASGRDLYSELIQLSDAMAFAFPEILNNIRSFLDDLLNTPLTPASNTQVLAANRKRFNTTFDLAAAGDSAAAQQITGDAQNYLNSLRATAGSDVAYRRSSSQVLAQLRLLADNPLGLPQFASGGYTGNGGSYEVAGVVHRGEYVMSKDATRRIGVGNLEAMHRSAKGAHGFGGSDRALERKLDALVSELSAFRSENRQLKLKLLQYSRKDSRVLQTWNTDGMPPERTA